MKKFTALLVSLLLLISVATAQPSDYTGTWYLVSMEAEGVTINPADMGMEMIMTLHDDGSAALSFTGEEPPEEAFWVLDGDTLTVTADGQPLSLMLTDNGQLTADQGDSTLLFGREPAAAGFEPAPEVAADDITAFDGAWTITRVNAFGMVLPFAAAAEMGVTDASVIIDNGSITAFGAEDAQTAMFTDGKLMISASSEEDFDKTVSLLEDGTLALRYMGIIFYLEQPEVME